jgi:hypothetical protein
MSLTTHPFPAPQVDTETTETAYRTLVAWMSSVLSSRSETFPQQVRSCEQEATTEDCEADEWTLRNPLDTRH